MKQAIMQVAIEDIKAAVQVISEAADPTERTMQQLLHQVCAL